MPLMRKPVSKKRKARSAERALTYKKRKNTKTLGLGRVTALTRNDFGFPDRLSTKLVYGDSINLTLTNGAIAFNTFRMNGLYDPDYTNVGHQPQWFDQLSAVYRNYRVKGSKITVDFVGDYGDITTSGTTSATYGPYLVGITTSNQNTLSASTAASLTEDTNGVSAVISKPIGGRPVKTLSNTFSPSRDLGLDPMEGDLSAVTSTVPVAQFFAHVYALDLYNPSTSKVTIRVKMEFQCEFFNRIEGVLS